MSKRNAEIFGQILVGLTMLAALPVSIKAQTEEPKYKIDVKWDKFKDIRTTVLNPMQTEQKKGLFPVLFFAGFDCPGTAACTPQEVIFVFLIATDSDGYHGQGIARAIRDGVRQQPYKLIDDGQIDAIPMSPLPVHVFRARMRPEALTLIANSKLMEYQIDGVEFNLTPDIMAGLRDLASRMK